MLKFSACIDMMYRENVFAERIGRAKTDKVSGIEFWRWSDKDLSKISEELKKTGLKAVLANLDSRDKGLSYDLSRGILSHNRVSDLIKAIHESAPELRRLGIKKAIVLAGDADGGIPYEKAIDNIKECLLHAVSAAEDEGLTLLLEPLNTFDRESYVMPFSAAAFDIVKSVGSASLKVLFDLYHTQRMEGNLIGTLKENIKYIGHFHAANSPWRCEPDLGEINYAQVFEEIEKSGYDEWIGFEYITKNADFSLGRYLERNGLCQENV